MNDLEFSLGLKVDAFQKNADEVVKSTKGIARGLEDIRKLITAGGLSAVAVGFLRDMADWAERAGDKLDNNVQALIRWKAALQDSSGIKSVFADALGPFIRGGETIGISLRAFGEAMKRDMGSNVSAVDRIKEIGRAWVAAVDAHEQDIRLSEVELAQGKERQRQLEKQRQEMADLDKESARLSERVRQADMERLTASERVNIIAKEYLEVSDKIANFSGKDTELKRLHNRYHEIGLQLLQAQREAQKEVASAAKDATKAEQDKAKAAAEARAELERQVQLQKEAGIAVDRANAAAADAGFEGLSAIEAEALSKWVAGGKKGPPPKITRTGRMGSSSTTLVDYQGILLGPTRSSNDFSQASDAVISEMIRRYNETLGRISGAQTLGAPDTVSGDFARSLALSQVGRNIRLAEEELRRREYYRVTPFDQALKNYEGDPLNFDRLYKMANQTYEEARETNRLLEKIKDGIPVLPLGDLWLRRS
jgi:chromosome segregation ATPase